MLRKSIFMTMAAAATLAVAVLPASAVGLAPSSPWSIVTTPHPLDTRGTISAVSCPTHSYCVATYVENGRVARWDGQRWTRLTLRNAGLGSLSGVSCPAAGHCVIVGAGPDAAVLDGNRATATSVPVPSDAQQPTLNQVSCASIDDCIAVGEYYDSSAGSDDVLIEHWDGAHWSLDDVSASDGSTPAGDLYAVSCATADRCMAVGALGQNGTLTAIAFSWDGSTWSKTDVPAPDGYSNTVPASVSCPTADACVLVGSAITEHFEAERGLVGTWDGAGWTTGLDSPTYADRDPELDGVSCLTATDCVAVGAAFDRHTDSHRAVAVERWDGTAWSVETAPRPARGYHSEFFGVSCVTRASCMAVGDYFVGTYKEEPLAEVRRR